MTYMQAKTLVKEHASSKYQGRKLVLLTKLVNSLYSPNAKQDVDRVQISKKVATVRGWLAGVSERQLRTIIAEIEEITTVSRDNGVIVCTLNLDPLKKVEKTKNLSKRLEKEQKADRAAKARVGRAEKREDKRMIDVQQFLSENRQRFCLFMRKPSNGVSVPNEVSQ